MQQNIKDIYGDMLAATDGDIGLVKDFYFDDATWMIRYLVANTATWLPGRLVLISPHALGKLEATEKIVHVNLLKKQIEDAPRADSHLPVSRQYESEYHRYYGWPAYWNSAGLGGLGGYPIGPSPSEEIAEAQRQDRTPCDKHLRSARALAGYRIQSEGGPIGHVSSFIVDDGIWAIRDVVVETGHWYYGKEILLSPKKIERIDYEKSIVFVSLSKEAVQRTPENENARAGAEAFSD